MEFVDLNGFSIVHPSSKGILFEHRNKLGLTQKQVAEKAGIPFQSYQRFESGERNLRTASFQMTCKILTALEMDIAKFYNGDYVLSDEIVTSEEGLRYKSTGKLIDEDTIEESNK